MRLLTPEDMASIRAGMSVNPDRFMRIFTKVLKAVEEGGDVLRNSLNYADPVRVAAEVEALTAAARRASRSHTNACACIPCRVRRADPREG